MGLRVLLIEGDAAGLPPHCAGVAPGAGCLHVCTCHERFLPLVEQPRRSRLSSRMCVFLVRTASRCCALFDEFDAGACGGR